MDRAAPGGDGGYGGIGVTMTTDHDDSGLSGRHGPPGGAGYAERPLVITWEITRACGLACRHCRADARPDRDPRELDTAEGRSFLETIRGFGEPFPVVVFTGGDPLMRSDLTHLVRYGTDLGLTMAVTPATTPRLTRRRLAALKEAGARRIALSVDAAAAERHDAFRGERGSFDVAMRAAGYAGDMGLPIQVNTTVTRFTIRDLREMAVLVERMDAVMWEVFFLVPVGRGRELEPLSPLQHERVLRWLYRHSRRAPYRIITVEAPFYRRIGRQVEARRRRERGGIGGGAPALSRGRFPGSTGDGNGFVFVSHTGEVLPSGFLPVSAGNVRRGDLVRIYRESEVFRKLRDRDALRGKCGACEFRFVCGGSRARAMAVHGDWMGPDPFCPYVPDGWEADGAGAGIPPGPGGPDDRSLPLTH